MSIPSSGSSTCRSASITSSFVTCMVASLATARGLSLGRWPLEPVQPDFVALLAAEEVDAVHEADPVAARAHHDGVRSRAVGVVAHAAEEVAVRDAGGRDDRLAGRELLRREDV